MTTRRLSLTLALLGLSTLLGANAARACKYCWAAEAAASEYTQQSMLPQGQVNTTPGAFPLDGTISQFQPSAAPAALATPPPADSIVTDAAGLRLTKAPAAISSTVSAPVSVPVASPLVPPVAAPAPAAGHFADAGLLGLAAVGGVFCWRTRRKPGSDR